MIDRRSILAGFAALATARVAGAQPTRKVYRIGILGSTATADMVGREPRNPTVEALLRGLRDLGYVYGQHFVTEPRGSEGKPERYAELAAELARLPLDVIVAAGPSLPALKQATSTIPVVMTASGDPVSEGLVQSLGRPGGNFTGLSSQSLDTTGKRLALLKELVPGTAAVAVLWDQSIFQYWQQAEAAARERGWKLLSFEIRDAGEIERAFKAATAARAGAVLMFGSGLFTFTQARHIVDLAAGSRLPVMYSLRPFVEAGGLISYGADIVDLWRRAAVFVDKILKGAKPANIPVEQPTKFELVINLKTAKALGITMPQTLLLRADEVIR